MGFEIQWPNSVGSMLLGLELDFFGGTDEKEKCLEERFEESYGIEPAVGVDGADDITSESMMATTTI